MDKLFEELDEGDKVSEAEPSSVRLWFLQYILLVLYWKLVHTFAAAGPRVWNSLPVHLREERIRDNSFRRELKTFWF